MTLPNDDRRMTIGEAIRFLAESGCKDWLLVLQVCQRASTSANNARDAVDALMRQFKYAIPFAQLTAARIWALLWLNCSSTFRAQCAVPAFLDTIEDVATNPLVAPVLRHRLRTVVATAACTDDSVDGSNHSGRQLPENVFRRLHRRINRRVHCIDQGVYPYIPEDMIVMPMCGQLPYKMPAGLTIGRLFSDMTSFPFVEKSARTPWPINLPQFVQDNTDISGVPSSSLMHRPLPSPPNLRIPLVEDRLSDIQSLLTSQELTEENIVLLMQWCKECRGYAADLLDPPSPGLHKTHMHIPYLYERCRKAQEQVFAWIPRATAQAKHSRAKAITEHEHMQELRAEVLVAYGYSRDDLAIYGEDEIEQTLEEHLLALLLWANTDLLRALGACKPADPPSVPVKAQLNVEAAAERSMLPLPTYGDSKGLTDKDRPPSYHEKEERLVTYVSEKGVSRWSEEIVQDRRLRRGGVLHQLKIKVRRWVAKRWPSAFGFGNET